MQMNRRDFVKALGVVTGALVLYSATSTERAFAASTSTRGGKAMLYDASKCVGCRACQNACKQWNKLPAESIGYGNIYENPSDLSAKTWTLIKAREVQGHIGKELLFCKYQCMHCTEASCEAVCPTGAISHHGSAVVIDQKVCIGCGYCIQACPFNVPHKRHGFAVGATGKCTFCADRQAEGLPPACVEVCPAEALQFGEQNDLITVGRTRAELLKTNGYENASLYGENELGGLHVLYVLPYQPSVYRLPEAPQLATSRVSTQWLSGIAAASLIAVMPFWLLFSRKNRINELSTQVNARKEK
jgi:formate dehydrogenase iron-sulfur subunit